MSYLEELLPEFRKGAKIRRKDWRDRKYIKLSGVYAKDKDGDVYFIEPNEITADDWELYQEPIDWQYIIDNKCLCWFWDDKEIKVFGYLCRFPEPKDHYLYKTQTHDGFKYFKNCRPVRRDEVTFYEDR